MRTLIVSDIHGNVESLEKILEKEKFEAILCAGDISDAGEYELYEENLEEVLEKFDVKDKLVGAIPGNMDPEKPCVKHLRQRRINLHMKICSFRKFEAVGYGGGITPFDTPFEPSGEEISNTIDQLSDRMKSDTKVAVIHQPPAKTNLDVANGEHVGSPEVKELIEKEDFDLLVTGHIHESRGTDEINGTKAVNPGPIQDGFYAIANIGGNIEVDLKKL